MNVWHKFGAALIAVAFAGCSNTANPSTSTTPESTTAALTTTSTVQLSTTTEPDEAGGAGLVGPTTLLPSIFPHPPAATCGVERQTVKTGEDPDATKVVLAPVPATIAQMVAAGGWGNMEGRLVVGPTSPAPPDSSGSVVVESCTVDVVVKAAAVDSGVVDMEGLAVLEHPANATAINAAPNLCHTFMAIRRVGSA